MTEDLNKLCLEMMTLWDFRVPALHPNTTLSEVLATTWHMDDETFDHFISRLIWMRSSVISYLDTQQKTIDFLERDFAAWDKERHENL